MSILCSLGFHKYQVSVINPENSTSICMCGGWRMFHKGGSGNLGPNTKTAGDCGHYSSQYIGWISCERCGGNLGELKYGWNKIG